MSMQEFADESWLNWWLVLPLRVLWWAVKLAVIAVAAVGLVLLLCSGVGAILALLGLGAAAARG